jgi:hypothetical protein
LSLVAADFSAKKFDCSEGIEVNSGSTCLDVEGELRAHDPLKLDDGDPAITARVDQQPSLSQDLKVRLRHVDPSILPHGYLCGVMRPCLEVYPQGSSYFTVCMMMESMAGEGLCCAHPELVCGCARKRTRVLRLAQNSDFVRLPSPSLSSACGKPTCQIDKPAYLSYLSTLACAHFLCSCPSPSMSLCSELTVQLQSRGYPCVYSFKLQ